jgi:hypothetical protein
MRSTFKVALLSIGVLFGIWSARPAPAQVLQTAYDFQTIQPHPYVHALGNATVAARGYPGAIGVNPATIGTEGAVRIGSNVNLSDAPLYSSPGISTSFADYWIAAPSATVKMGSWAGAAQVKHFSRGSLEIRSPQGERLYTVNVFEQSIKLAGAYDATSALTVGGAINLLRSRGLYQEGKGVKTHPTFDLGVHYQTRMEQELVALHPSGGLSITDFGGNVSIQDRPGERAAPTTIRGGGALDVTSQSKQFGRPEWRIGLYGALSNLLVSGEFKEENGRTYFEADGPFRALYSGWGTTKGVIGPAGERSTIGTWERITKHVGMEMSVLDILSLRLGRFHESDDNGGRQYTALGFGLDAYYVSLDASWTLGDEEPFQQFSYGRLTVRIPLSDSPRNFWPALLGNGE